jgi:type I restriction enzyme S subunit
MAGDGWTTTRVGEVASINPDAIGENWPHSHIRYIDISSVGVGQIEVTPGWMKLSDAPSRAKRLVRKGDTVLSTVRPNRRSMFFASEPGEDWVISTGFAVLRPNVKLVEPRFLYACVFNPAFTEYLVTREKGAAYPAVSPDDIANAEIRLPPLSEQRAIAHILGTLDDKIELNRRMSQTLEAMARALFKSWFVDFDPVRAKIEGRWRRGQSLPGLPAHLYDLFPARLVDSELGEIPEGWRVGRLGEYIENFDSKRVPLSSREREKLRGIYPYYGAAGVVDYVNDYLFDDIYVLVGEDGSIVTESGHAITQYVWGKFWVNNHAHVLQGRHPVSTEQLYLYFAFESVAPYVTGAVQPKLSQGRMNTMPFLFAGEKMCLEFQRLIEPWFTTYRKRSGESRTLAALRDALLPKLIRGEIRVKEVERFLMERGL